MMALDRSDCIREEDQEGRPHRSGGKKEERKIRSSHKQACISRCCTTAQRLRASRTQWHAKENSVSVAEFLKAAARGKVEVVEEYLQQGGDPDSCDSTHRTALHQSSQAGHLEVVQKLIDKGAQLENKDKLKSTAMHCASRGGHVAVLETLLDSGASIKATDSILSSPLHVAARVGQYNVAEFLIERGANVNAQDKEGDTPLHEVMRQALPKFAQLLISAGASVGAKNYTGKSAVDMLPPMNNETKTAMNNVINSAQN
ncbi:uncharacterized protein LOC144931496 isoform X1 [Lampetra fluviatilis]